MDPVVTHPARKRFAECSPVRAGAPGGRPQRADRGKLAAMVEAAPPRKNKAAERAAGARGWAFVGMLLLVLGASSLFYARGLSRGLDGSLDLTMVYAGSRQLVLGDNPYDFDRAYDAFIEAGGSGRPRDPAWFSLLYPPFTYALLAPLGLMSWAGAKTAWLACNLLATAAVAGWLIRHRPRSTLGPSAAAAVSLWLACGALHTAVTFGQLSLVPLALMLPLLGPTAAADTWGWRRPRTVVAGAMLAVAGLIKPQLVAPLAFVLLFTTRRAAVAWSAGFGLAAVAASLVWVYAVEPDWLTHWREQLAAFTDTGMARPTAQNPYTHQMINLEPWLHRLWPGGVGPEAPLRLAAVALPSLGLLAAAWALWRTRSQTAKIMHHPKQSTPADDPLLLVLGLACVLTLLPVYHRTYDAVLLVVPGLWAWRRLAANRRDATAWVTLAGLATFMVPGPVGLVMLENRDLIPGAGAGAVTDRWLWRAVVVPHHNIALVVLSLTLGWRAWRSAHPGRADPSPA